VTGAIQLTTPQILGAFLARPSASLDSSSAYSHARVAWLLPPTFCLVHEAKKESLICLAGESAGADRDHLSWTAPSLAAGRRWLRLTTW
jgi:hypothetical protein